MSSEEINAVINNLCEKLGTTASQLLPEIAKMKTAECMMSILLYLAVVLISAFLLIKGFKKSKENDWEGVWCLILIVSAIGVLFFGVGLIDDSINLAGWAASPTAKALFYVMEKIKG